MKMKSLKVFSIFLILFACVFANAQVIESVSYTPAKSGKYNNLATKHLTVFNGNVNVGSGLIGRGELLQIDVADNQNIGFASGAQITSGQDLYLLSGVATLPSLSVSKDGKLISTVNATVAFAPQATEISGGDVNFEGVTASLASDGKLNIDTVRMENPNCTLKWAKLPAYTQSKAVGSANDSNLGYYWFAYCDYNPCTEGQYYYGNACHDCPLGKTNIAPAGQTPNCVTITTDFEDNITMIGTCSAGWDGTTCLEGDLCLKNSCVYRRDISNAFSVKSSFTCSSQVIKRCTLSNDNRVGTLSSKYGSFCNKYSATTTASRITQTKAGDEIKPKKAKCGGLFSKVKGSVVEPMYNEAVNSSFFGLLDGRSYYIADPTEDGTMTCTGSARRLSQERQDELKAARAEGIRKTFCGFSGTSASAANIDIKNNILGASESVSCVSETEFGLNNFPYCSDLLANAGLIKKPNLSTESDRKKICAIIKRTYTGTLGTSFTCIWKGPKLDKYKAARAAQCGETYQKYYDKCNETKTCLDNPDVTYCPQGDQSTTSFADVMKKRPWDTDGTDSEWVLSDCSNADVRLQTGRPTDITIYLPQVVNDGSLLSCAFSS